MARLPLTRTFQGVTTLQIEPQLDVDAVTVSPREFGARGDGVTDDTAAFEAAVAAVVSAGAVLSIPPTSASWRISRPILVTAGMRIVGAGRRGKILWAGGDLPVLAYAGYTDTSAAGADYAEIENILIDDWTLNPSRKSHWTVNLANAVGIYLNRVQVEGRLSADPEDLYGILLGKHPSGSFSGPTWEHELVACIMRRARVWLNSSDNTITGGRYYALGRDHAIRVGGGIVIQGATIIPGEVEGGLYIRHSDPASTDIFSVKMTGCHVDGNNEARTPRAVYAPAAQLVTTSLFEGNTCWNISGPGIEIENGEGIVVGPNTWRNCDAENEGKPDIVITGNNCIVHPQAHRRTNTYPKGTGAGGARTNLAPPVVLTGTGNVILRGTVSEDSNDYLDPQFASVPSASEGRLVRLREDFLGSALPNDWGTQIGSNGVCAAATPLSAVGGKVRMTFGTDAGGTVALNGSQLHQARMWRCFEGGLAFEARLRLNGITGLAFFVGLTDETALECPFTLGASDVLTAIASDAAGFLFDTNATTDNWWLVGVKAGVAATHVNTAVAPVTATDVVLRCAFTVGGAMNAWINGTHVGTVTNAVTATTLLTPVVVGFSRGTGAKTADVDLLMVEQLR